MSSFPRLVKDMEEEAQRLQALVQSDNSLKSGGGGGISGSMEALIDAKIEAAEARTDAKFAQVLAKLDTLTTEVRASRSSIWTAAFAIMGLILAVVAIIVSVAPSAFSAGAQVREIAREEARAVAPAAATVPEAIATPELVPAKKP